VAVSAAALGDVLAGLVRDAVVPGDRDPAAAALGGAPRWVVTPSSADEVSAVLALAHAEQLALIPRGSGSALDLGRSPGCADILLDLRRLDGVVEYNPDDLTVTVGAGATAGALAARLARRGQFLALDPPGAESRTVGGIAATNASGPLRARYGTMRDLLLGVRFVQADGTVTWGGARVVKSVTGYDVPKLMVGALGTLGVLTELTLRLHPRPEVERSWLITLGEPSAAQALVGLVLDSTLQPSRLELLNAAALAACGTAGEGAAIAVSFGTVEAAVRAQGDRLAALAARAGGRSAPVAGDFWARHAAAALGPPESVALAVTTLPGRLADTVSAIERATAAAGLSPPPVIQGCASLGCLRVRLPLVEGGPLAGLVERLRDFAAGVGGSVVVEHGPHAVRAAVDPWGPIPPGPLHLMRGLKHEFDPRRVLNPGRFVGGI
jgi:glycolate oxidase FAD binding subunit